MEYSLRQIIVAAGDSGESTIWIQLLVLVILASLWGIYNLVKSKADRFKEPEQNYPEVVHGAQAHQPRRQNKALKGLKDRWPGVFSKPTQSQGIIKKPVFDFDVREAASETKVGNEPAAERVRNLTGGMEMLQLDFLLGVVENTEGADSNNVMMRKLSFNELRRREQLKAADSNALKVYTIDKNKLYGKDIQYEAMRELTERTGSGWD